MQGRLPRGADSMIGRPRLQACLGEIRHQVSPSRAAAITAAHSPTPEHRRHASRRIGPPILDS